MPKSQLDLNRMARFVRWLIVCVVVAVAHPAIAQERPYFVTYDDHLAEPKELEIAVASTTGLPKENRSVYTAPWLEIEYGVTPRWTTELYLEGVTTTRDGSGFTGWRWENRFRPLKNQHRINPVLYVEYENVSEASRIQKEIDGSGSLPFEPIADLNEERAHEIEGKLILSSTAGAWNVSENFVIEKNLSESEGIEFGYAVGASRLLGAAAGGRSCVLCRESLSVGVEAYGGLGSTPESGLSDTRHYVAPVLGWRVGHEMTFKVSVGFGLTEASDRALFRVAVAFEP